MPRILDVSYARCPFFVSSGKKSVTCEGITDDCTTCLTFVSEETRNLHRRVFCDARYENCEVYRMLIQKYEE